MTPNHASTAATEALRKNAQARSAAARRRIDKAIKDLRKREAKINVNSVAKKANVARQTIYKHQDLLDTIHAHARQIPTESAPVHRETTIIEALRSQLTAKDQTIRSLRDTVKQKEETIANLYGEITRLTDARQDPR